MEDVVKVSVRIKPIFPEEENPCLRIISKNPPVLFSVERPQEFILDNVYTEETSQEDVYNESVKFLVDHVKEGYNCTVLAYGQTGTGKTYTMGTDPNVKNENDLGIIPRTLQEFFEFRHDDEELQVQLFVSFIEIYNEKVYDLLQLDNKIPLQLKGLNAQGYNKKKLQNYSEAKNYLIIGNKNRHTAGTNQNPQSSRSHAIFTIYCNIQTKDSEKTSKLHLVDLAGSESVKKNGNTGNTRLEGVNINMGLLNIGKVMTALASNAKYIPYRESCITKILKDSLNKKSFVSLIACISLIRNDHTETLQTLEFAQRVKKLRTKPEINEMISRFKKENPDILPCTISNTPFKRPPSYLDTPRLPIKKTNLISTEESNFSTFSVDHTSSLITPDVIQQAVSPIVRKHIRIMQDSILDRVEKTIINTIKRPSRISNLRNNTDTHNSPLVTWNTIKCGLSKLIRNELAEFGSTGNVITSSPIHKPQYDEENIFSNTEFIFKKPISPVRTKLILEPNDSILSSIQNFDTVPRRSTRLSIKNSNICSETINDTNDYLSITGSQPMVRRSIRLAQKNDTIYNLTNLGEESFTQKSGTVKVTRPKINKIAKPKLKPTLTIMNTPIGKRLLGKNISSPLTSHTNDVLRILNNGTAKDLEVLPCIGPKTSYQILLSRRLNGKLNQISELKDILGWSSRKLEMFIKKNSLKQELV